MSLNFLWSLLCLPATFTIHTVIFTVMFDVILMVGLNSIMFNLRPKWTGTLSIAAMPSGLWRSF